MVVNYTESGWEVITQRAHGILAAQLAMQWRWKDLPGRWLETLLAIAEHDDAEIELDGENLLTPSGGPLNFAMKSFEVQHCEKLTMLSQSKSRYIALLTSMHMDFLYRNEAKENKIARQFLKEQKKQRAIWQKELGITAPALQKVYSLLEWCDALSLLLCQHQVQPEKRAIEVSTGPDKLQYYLFQMGENSLTVDPWPFGPPAFKVYVESRGIKQLQFTNTAEFRQAFTNAVVKETVWEIRKLSTKHREPPKV